MRQDVNDDGDKVNPFALFDGADAPPDGLALREALLRERDGHGLALKL